jgi:hypothetical protein
VRERWLAKANKNEKVEANPSDQLNKLQRQGLFPHELVPRDRNKYEQARVQDATRFTHVPQKSHVSMQS